MFISVLFVYARIDIRFIYYYYKRVYIYVHMPWQCQWYAKRGSPQRSTGFLWLYIRLFHWRCLPYFLLFLVCMCVCVYEYSYSSASSISIAIQQFYCSIILGSIHIRVYKCVYSIARMKWNRYIIIIRISCTITIRIYISQISTKLHFQRQHRAPFNVNRQNICTQKQIV